jgi:hypothetical protein
LTAVAVALEGADQLLLAHVLMLRIGQQSQGLGLFLGVGAFVDALQAADERFAKTFGVEHIVGDLAQGDDTTGFLSLSRSISSGAPAEIARARCAASSTRLKRLGTFSTQSSTVTRAMESSDGG